MKCKSYFQFAIIWFIVSSHLVNGQIYFSEDFESGIPSNWSVDYVGDTSDVEWVINNGGALIGSFKFPPAAKNGVFNAFFREVGSEGERTQLITHVLDLKNAEIPELSFWHAQAEWGVGTGDHERLRVKIRNGANGEWVQIAEYLDPVPSWEERALFIADTLLSDSVYFAFEGETKFGAGLCIDSVKLVEKGVIPYQLNFSEYEFAENKPIATGTEYNPVLQVNLNAYGNTGALTLNKFSVELPDINPGNIAASGAHLFATTRPHFHTQNPVVNDVSITNDSIVFNNIDYDLNFEDNYFWLALDIDTSAICNESIQAKFKNHGIKLSVDTTGFYQYPGVWVNGDTIFYVVGTDTITGWMDFSVPESNVSTEGERVIKDLLFFEDFESTTAWTLGGDFQIDSAQGKGNVDLRGNPDPSFALQGKNILGTDISGIGPKKGDYEKNQLVYYATLDVQNAFYYYDLHLAYYHWINKEAIDEFYFQVSADSGSTWVNIKTYENLKQNYWAYDTAHISNFNIKQTENLMVRLSMGPTSSIDDYSGINIDNLAIFGNFIDSDVGVVDIIMPDDGCGHSSADSVKIWIRNYAGIPVADTRPIPVYYSLDGGITKIYDTVYANIPVKDSVLVTLNTTVDMLLPDIYELLVSTDLPDDEGPHNDEQTKIVYAFPTYTPGYTETFESTEGVFKDYGANEKWQWGTASGALQPAPSGSKIWATNISGNYSNNDSSYLETGCYDFSGGGRHLLEFDYWMNTESAEDGFNIQYSTDDGTTWHVLDTNEFGYNWGWYADTVQALNNIGFSGYSSGWKLTRQLLPESFNTESSVKFRVHFASGTDSTNAGIAIDDFRIYPAPKDIGVSAITTITDTCQYANPDSVTISIENYGLNTLNNGEEIVVGYQISGNLGGDSYNENDLDTFALSAELLPGQTVNYTFDKKIDIITPGDYTIKSYTLYEADPMFYFANNDTGTLAFQVKPNPVTLLQDTITTKEPDTVVIRPKKDPNYAYLWDDLTTADTFDVPEQGVYHVTVTDTGGNQCFSYDSMYVELLFNDAGIDSLVSPVTSCELGSSEYLTVWLYNFGTDSLLAGEPVDIYFEMNDNPPQLQSIILPEKIYRQRGYPIQLDNHPLDLSTPGKYTFKLYTDIGGDTIPSNDTTVAVVDVYGYPDLDIGPDTSLEAYNYALIANPGHDTYLWDDGSSNDTLSIDETNWGLRSVEVTDTNNCTSYDTAYVRLVIRDIVPKDLTSPVSDCELSTESQVSMVYENIGNDTLLTGQKVFLSYQINGQARVTDSVVLESAFYPNTEKAFTFDSLADFSQPNNYQVSITASSYNDLTKTNDTISKLVIIDNNPDIDFAVKNDTTIYAYSYALEAQQGTHWTYTWKNDVNDILQTGANNVYTVLQSDDYHVIATDTVTGCTGSDTLRVILRVRDFYLESDDVDLVQCQDETVIPTISVRNNGNFTITTGMLDIKYVTSGSDTLTYSYNIGSSFSPGSVRQIELDGTTFPTTGSKSIYYNMEFDGDMNLDNNTLQKNVSVNAKPNIQLEGGKDTVVTEFPYTLDAGGGFVQYTWQDATTGRTYTVNNTNRYEVTVIDFNGCTASDAVYIKESGGVGIDASMVERIKLFPVPAREVINFSIGFKQSVNPEVRIYDMTGKIVFKQQYYPTTILDGSIGIDHLPTGIYSFQVLDDELLFRRNIIISE